MLGAAEAHGRPPARDAFAAIVDLCVQLDAASEAVGGATWEIRVVLAPRVPRGKWDLHTSIVEAQAALGEWSLVIRTPVADDDVARAYAATLRTMLAALRELEVPVYVPTLAERVAVEDAARGAQ